MHTHSSQFFVASTICYILIFRPKPEKKKPRFAIMVHGGAYNIPDEIKDEAELGCRKAAYKGYVILNAGGSAMDAVEHAVNELENNPVFDAGFGSVLTRDEQVEMDAIIMNGDDLSCGSVACVTSVKHPISLARKVMEETQHTLIVGKGADAFSKEMGMPQVTVDDLVTDIARAEFEKFKGYGSVVDNVFNTNVVQHGHDTVGCVAIDEAGNIVAGTSTGGITNKLPGRVGDSPIIGSGCYSDKSIGGISTTGHGESIVKVVLAKSILDYMKITEGTQFSPADCIRDNLDTMEEKVGGCGGVICITKNGECIRDYNTPRMCYAEISQSMPTETEIVNKSGKIVTMFSNESKSGYGRKVNSWNVHDFDSKI
ncbi:hypothetical protein ScalyP_jg6017 [Parmales sp. scaly parma]|nr:hypothetical protein ScalyP_jg6017 [Parmales sp. scaly parma]